jgi:hypothetical protein
MGRANTKTGAEAGIGAGETEEAIAGLPVRAVKVCYPEYFVITLSNARASSGVGTTPPRTS